MLQLILEQFNILRKKYNWGSNLYYHYASNNEIHPTFVQLLLEDRRYDNEQTLDALEYLSQIDSTSFMLIL